MVADVIAQDVILVIVFEDTNDLFRAEGLTAHDPVVRHPPDVGAQPGHAATLAPDRELAADDRKSLTQRADNQV